MTSPEGQLLAGKYRVERVLGRGGMGIVVAAHHIVLDEVVAIKFLLPEALHSAEAVARFEREARAAVKIKSEHVARVTDVGRLDTGAPYMVMELLRGRDLGAVLQEDGPLPLEDVADYLLQAGEAIAEAHGLGIVHRDLKPPNLFLTRRADGSSCVKVLDFGISKVTGSNASADQGMTATSAIMGSPLYMSPEQLMSARDVDMRTDVWALGVICFELLTRTLPFSAETLPQLCMAISTLPPVPLRQLRPDLPARLEALLLRCLAKDRSQRVSNVAEFAAELVLFAPARARLSADRIERLARSAGFGAPSVPAPPSGTVALPPSPRAEPKTESVASGATVAEFGRTKPVAPSHAARRGLIAAALLALGSAGAFAVWSKTTSHNANADVHSSATSPEPSATPPPAAVTAVAVPTGAPHPELPAAVSAAPLALALAASSAPKAQRPAGPSLAMASRKKAGPESHPQAQAPAKAVEAPSADCDIPYFFDARGNRVFKKGCL
jgi:eukaryotic-like serine/threonine-protein kinase